MTKAAIAFTSLSLVMVGGRMWEMTGIPIGGLLSGACVSITLGAQDWRWLRNDEAHQRAGFGLVSGLRPPGQCDSPLLLFVCSAMKWSTSKGATLPV